MGVGRHLDTGSTTLAEKPRRTAPSVQTNWSTNSSVHAAASVKPEASPRFTVAIVCVLPLEYDALAATLDGKPQVLPHADDRFIYTTGVLAGREVVIAYPEDYGPRDAALAVQLLEQKYGNMELIILLGICAGVPMPPCREKPIYLGDVIISTAVLAYAHGARKNPAGLELREIFPQKTKAKIRQMLHLLATEPFSEDLAERSRERLCKLSSTKDRYCLLPADEDLCFNPSYHHLHHSPCPDNKCDAHAPDICQGAEQTSCLELQCDRRYLARCRPPYETTPLGIHFGVFASADIIMRDAKVRDDLATRHKILAFDMEVTGIWDLSPNVVVIKGVCDYGDSHKTKQWQDLAAAHAACTAKVFIEIFFPKATDPQDHLDESPTAYGRDECLEVLWTPNPHNYKRRIKQNTESQNPRSHNTLPAPDTVLSSLGADISFSSTMRNTEQQQGAEQPSPNDEIIPTVITQICKSVQFHSSQGNHEIARAHVDLLNQIAERQAAHSRLSVKAATLLNGKEDSWMLQIEQMLKFLSQVDLNPDVRLESATRLRDASRHKSSCELPPFWLSTKYRQWKDMKGSSLLIVEGTFRLESAIKSICVEMIELVRKANIPVLWALKTREDPRVSDHLPVSIFKSLVSQSLRVNPILRVQNVAGLTYGHIQDAITEDDWVKLLGRATMGIPELMVLVDMELFGPVSSTNSAAGSLSVLRTFSALLDDLAKLNPHTTMKIILVSYGSRAFATHGMPELKDKVIHLGEVTRKQATSKPKITSMAQKRSLGRSLWRSGDLGKNKIYRKRISGPLL